MKVYTILRILAFLANCIGGYFLVRDWLTFLVLTGVVLFNFLEGISKGENI